MSEFNKYSTDGGATFIDVEDSNAVHWADNTILGAKNLLKNNALTTEISGVTFTVNSDGSVTLNGTATENITSFFINSNMALKAGSYWLTGNPNGITGTSYGLRIANTSYSVNTFFEQGKILTLNQDYSDLRVNIRIPNGQVIDNLTFYPMIRLADDTDSTYVQYAMTNEELTKNKIEKNAFGQIENGDTASKNYVLGDVFQKDNEFNYTSASISQGASLVSGTNYSHLNMDQMIRDSMHFRRTMTINRTAKTGTYNPILQNSDCYNSLWMITWGTSNEDSGIGIIALAKMYQHYIAEIVYTSPISCKIDSVTFDGTTITVTMTTDAFWVMNIKALSYGAN